MNLTKGVVARFDSPEELIAAIQNLREVGYTHLEAYTPFPIHGIDHALGRSRSKLPWIVLLGGLVGCFSGYFVQWYLSAIVYPLLVGGKPFNSREAWIPITFEMTILFASFAAVGGMLIFNKLPRLYHPIFDAPAFVRASDDSFFLTISGLDHKYDPQNTSNLLRAYGGLDVIDCGLED